MNGHPTPPPIDAHPAHRLFVNSDIATGVVPAYRVTRDELMRFMLERDAAVPSSPQKFTAWTYPLLSPHGLSWVRKTLAISWCVGIRLPGTRPVPGAIGPQLENRLEDVRTDLYLEGVVPDGNISAFHLPTLRRKGVKLRIRARNLLDTENRICWALRTRDAGGFTPMFEHTSVLLKAIHSLTRDQAKLIEASAAAGGDFTQWADILNISAGGWTWLVDTLPELRRVDMFLWTVAHEDVLEANIRYPSTEGLFAGPPKRKKTWRPEGAELARLQAHAVRVREAKVAAREKLPDSRQPRQRGPIKQPKNYEARKRNMRRAHAATAKKRLTHAFRQGRWVLRTSLPPDDAKYLPPSAGID